MSVESNPTVAFWVGNKPTLVGNNPTGQICVENNMSLATNHAIYDLKTI